MDATLTRPVRVWELRRAILAGALGALAAVTTQALGRPLRVDATNGDPLLAGEIKNATTSTGVSTTSANGLQGSTADGLASGVFGQNNGGGPGVHGSSSSGNGTTGASSTGDGIVGVSGFGHGVTGVAFGKPGVLGKSAGRATGVLGWIAVDDAEVEPTASPDTGVYGFAKGDPFDRTAARGVVGEAPAGRGVSGIATTGTGVFATSASGMAIQAQGRVAFSTSGLTTVSAGTSSVTITPGVDLVTSTRILCTLESNQSAIAVQRITKNTTANNFKVFLSKPVAAGKTVKVAWFAIG